MRTDDNKVVIDDNCLLNFEGTVSFDETSCYNSLGAKLFNFSSLSLSEAYRGNRTIVKDAVIFEPNFDGYVKVCHKPGDSTVYYEYEKVEYVTNNTVTNIVTNPNKFVNTSGWKGSTGIIPITKIYPEYDASSSQTLD